jgi:hypothetical protein
VKLEDLANDSVSAAKVQTGSLTGSDIKDATVQSADVADHSLTGTDVSDGTLGSWDLNPVVVPETLDQIERVYEGSDPGASTSFGVTVQCPSGKRPVGGGGVLVVSGRTFITQSYPQGIESGSGWAVRWETDNAVSLDPTAMTGYALCAPTRMN